MKNILKYYYNLLPDEIIRKKDEYKIKVNKYTYYFMPYYGNINDLIFIYSNIINNNPYIDEIVLNKNNNILTYIDNINYILLKSRINETNISFYEIINFSYFIEKGVCNWRNLWINKIDYYEYHISQNKMKYKNLYNSFYYYAGLCECAINLLNSVNSNNVNLYISHERIKKDTTNISFYNPLNMTLDSKVRDVCEYFKAQFFYCENPLYKVKEYLSITPLTNDEAIMFFARLLYPSYYFDVYDDILRGDYNKKKLDVIISKNQVYEKFLEDVYFYMINIYNIPEIEWIIKKVA